MSNSRRNFEEQDYVHFVTFSCYKRRRLMSHERICKVVLETLSQKLTSYGANCSGFVLMPNHLHCLLQLHGACSLAEFLQRWKQESALRANQAILKFLPDYAEAVNNEDSFWQSGYYDFPIESEEKLEEKLAYIHNNPVRAELVSQPVDWKWSSARWYSERRSVGVPITWPK
ncbi:MAG: hypothetical protein CMJ47_01825 [Planctomyces sp.]|nr:hypothetical protein [Planctomyces sp.]